MQQIQQLKPADFEQQAQQIGTNTLTLIQKLLQADKFWATIHNLCLGLLRLANKYNKNQLEAACQRALICPQITLKTVVNILQQNLDKQPLPTQATQSGTQLPEHEHIRVPQNYQ